MLQQIKSYLKFLFHSKNEHGVHSPFVFDLVTKCFYKKDFIIQSEKYPTQNTLILKTIQYLKLVKCVCFNSSLKIDSAIDCVIIPSSNLNDFSLNTILPFCTNETCIFVENIHQSKEIEDFWKNLCDNGEISVSIETFNLGFLFLRKEQQKEHFIINSNKTMSSHLFERIRF